MGLQLVSADYLHEDGIRDVERSRGLGDVYKRQAQRDLVGDWYRSKVSSNPEYTDAVTGAAKAFVLIGDLNASAAGMAWQTIIPDLLEQGHDLEFNVTKEQVTAAAARWIVAVADTFTPPSLD